MRIGIFGGSFDPPHLGHVKLVEAAAAHCALDRVLIVPAARSPFKTRSYSTDEDRMELCRRTFPAVCGISDFEIRRGGVSYTIDTVLHFRELYPEAALYLIVGEDQLLLFHKWFRWQDILRNAGLIAAVRSDPANRAVLERAAEEKLRSAGEVNVLEFTPLPVSSTELRRRIAAGESVRGLLAPSARSYIKERGLYRED